MINFLSTKRILKSWDEDNIPGDAPRRLPVATNAEAFISKVKPDADFRLIAGVARGVSAGDVDEDVLDIWADAVAENRDEIKDHRALVKQWPMNVTECIGYVKTSCEGFVDSRRAISTVVEDVDELPNLKAALKKTFGDATADSRVEDLIALLFMCFKSGDTAEQHSLKTHELLDKLQRSEADGGFGQTISLDLLCRIFFVRNLQVFATFSSISEQISQLSPLDGEPEVSTAQVTDMFVNAKRSSKEIVIAQNENVAAMQKMMNMNFAMSKPKIPRGKHPRNLGGANASEGFALLAGTLSTSNQPSNYPSGACGFCWEFGHFKRTCQNPPHPQSTDPDAMKASQGKGGGRQNQQLWSGRQQQAKQALAAIQQQQPPKQDLGGDDSEDMVLAAEFAALSNLAFQEFSDNVRSGAKKVNCENYCFPASEHFELSEQEKQKNLKRPLRTKPVRENLQKSVGWLIEMLIDSGCYRNMGPLDEVQSCVLDPVGVENESVLTADSDSPPLEIKLRGNLCGKLKTERGLYKETELQFSGVENLRKWLFSVAEAVRNRHILHFQAEIDGGSWLQFHGSCERVPIEFTDNNQFRIILKRDKQERLSTRQKQEVNFKTHCKSTHIDHRILSETVRRKLVRNFEYFPDVDFGTDETCLEMKGQKAPFPKEAQWRPRKVGGLVRMDCKKIPKSLAKCSKIKYLLTIKDAKSRFVRRFYLTGTARLHQWTLLYRNFIRRKGHTLAHVMADGEFQTAGLAELAATEPTFDFSFSSPHCQSQNGLAEADIKRWDKGVRCILDHAMKDPKSKVTYKHFPYASECLTDIENSVFNPQCPEMTPFEAVEGIMPDASVWQIPLSRCWYYIYTDLREGVPFAARRAEGIFCGLDHEIAGYKVLNLSSNRLLTRRFADVVFREPGEVWSHGDTVTEFEAMVASGEIVLTARERQLTFETSPQADNLVSIQDGNDLPVGGEINVQPLVTNPYSVLDSDSDEDSDSDSGSESDHEDPHGHDHGGGYFGLTQDDDSDGEHEHIAAFATSDSLPLKVIPLLTKHPDGAALDLSGGVLNLSESTDSNVPSQIFSMSESLSERVGFNSTSHWNDMHKYSADLRPNPALQKLPKLVVAQTGEAFEQHVTVDVSDTAALEQFRENQLQEQMSMALSAVVNLDCPSSWEKAMKSADKSDWLDADAEEDRRMSDFEAYTAVPIASVKEAIGHLLRVLRVKPDEKKVRWVYDEARAGGDKDFETFASVLRVQTSRLLNLKAAHLGHRVLRGDFTSAFLHILADEPFYTYFPAGHPGSCGGTMCMMWRKLVYGKGNAPRGLRQDIKTTLEALGFVEQPSDVDECLYVHAEREIDFGLYVDDVEIAASDDSLLWVREQFDKRYELKWLGYTTKNCLESSDKSKTYVGVRTEVDPVTKIVTQDQTQLINKMANQLGFDRTRPRYHPPSTRMFPPLEDGIEVEAKFHRAYRQKVGMLAHVAITSRPDLAFAAVNAARRLNDPVIECDRYVDEAMQFLFSTADDKITFNCTQPLGSTLFISSDSSLADNPDGRSTAGWVSMCAGGAWAWAVETLRLALLSSTEAEYCSTSSACKEVLAQKKLFKSFGLDFPNQYPVLVDNMSAIALACGPSAHYQRTKHIETKYHFQRRLLLDGVVRLQHQATGEQVSDILTKNLGKVLHKKHRSVMSGRVPIVIDSHKLPESNKVYIRRHNDEVERRTKLIALQKAFSASTKGKQPDVSSADKIKLVTAMLAMLV